MNKQNVTEDVIEAVRKSLADRTFVKLSLGGYRGGVEHLKSLHVRHVVIKREDKLSFTYRYKTRDVVKNFGVEEGVNQITNLIKTDFTTANLMTTQFDLLWQGRGIKKTPPRQVTTASTDHNRLKKRPIASAGQAYLRALKLTDDQGAVLPTAQDKFRQINKFIEIVGGLLPELPDRDRLNIVDMGAGKGYLTFALYDFLVNQSLCAHVTGIEARADLVALCNTIAIDCGFQNLKFVQGRIFDYDATFAHILIALHACDTATDDAIASGIRANVDLMILSPCCHKQIRRAIEAEKPNNEMTFLTRHGIFMERYAEMATDGLRAMILEYFGYKTKIIEFISDTHTAKNVMIIAVKSGNGPVRKPAVLDRIAAAKAWMGIHTHYLEQATGLAPKG